MWYELYVCACKQAGVQALVALQLTCCCEAVIIVRCIPFSTRFLKWTSELCIRGVSNCWMGIWNGTMEWKMEWNSECITAVAANLCNWCCSIQVELRGVSLGLFYLTSKVSWASSACFYIQAWYYIVLLQAHFLSYFCKARLSYKKQQSGFARLLLWNFYGQQCDGKI